MSDYHPQEDGSLQRHLLLISLIKSKHMDSFMELSIFVTRIIAHGHGDICYAHYGLDIFLTDSNHTMGSIAKLFRDLELAPKHSSHELFLESRSAPLFIALLVGAKMCTSSLPS